MFLIAAKYLIPKGYRGLALFPFVFVKYALDKKNEFFVNHERIHLRQQLEMLVIPFSSGYFLEFLVRFIQYGILIWPIETSVFSEKLTPKKKT